MGPETFDIDECNFSTVKLSIRNNFRLLFENYEKYSEYISNLKILDLNNFVLKEFTLGNNNYVYPNLNVGSYKIVISLESQTQSLKSVIYNFPILIDNISFKFKVTLPILIEKTINFELNNSDVALNNPIVISSFAEIGLFKIKNINNDEFTYNITNNNLNSIDLRIFLKIGDYQILNFPFKYVDDKLRFIFNNMKLSVLNDPPIIILNIVKRFYNISKIRIEKSDDTINLSQLMVYNEYDINISSLKNVISSGIWSIYTPTKNLVDGIEDPKNYMDSTERGNIFHTEGFTNQFVEIDLNSFNIIKNIKIINRNDGYSERIINADLILKRNDTEINRRKINTSDSTCPNCSGNYLLNLELFPN